MRREAVSSMDLVDLVEELVDQEEAITGYQEEVHLCMEPVGCE